METPLWMRVSLRGPGRENDSFCISGRGCAGDGLIYFLSLSLSALLFIFFAHGLWTGEAHTRRRTWVVVHIWAFCRADFFLLPKSTARLVELAGNRVTPCTRSGMCNT
jgi:hypothetical protein